LVTLLGPAAGVVIVTLVLVAAPVAWWWLQRRPGQCAEGTVAATRHEELPTVQPPPAPEALATAQLCLAWQRSYFALLDLPQGPAHGEIVRVRECLLDEFERRDCDGFTRWLQTGEPGPARFRGRVRAARSRPPDGREDAAHTPPYTVAPRRAPRSTGRPPGRGQRFHPHAEGSVIMRTLSIIVVVVVLVLLLGIGMGVRIVKEYEKGVVFRLGRVVGSLAPGFRVIIPFVDVMHRVTLQIITMPIQSQGIITRDNVSVDVSAVAYFRVVDAVKSVVAIENVYAAIDQIAQTTLRKVVGQHTLDETLSETDRINQDIREILDVNTVDWGVEVTLVELKDIQLPDSMKRAMARQAEAEREKRAKIINAEGESLAAAALGDASDIMAAHPLALQLRTLQSLVEIGVDKKQHRGVSRPADEHHRELGAFLAQETAAANQTARSTAASRPTHQATANGASTPN
ncbi:MAG TPA: slipin family protein, partial [Pseudonocardiaceae bacterium]|nr:slipin family protein [Pseudonocardiaceae bacterium]